MLFLRGPKSAPKRSGLNWGHRSFRVVEIKFCTCKIDFFFENRFLKFWFLSFVASKARQMRYGLSHGRNTRRTLKHQEFLNLFCLPQSRRPNLIERVIKWLKFIPVNFFFLIFFFWYI